MPVTIRTHPNDGDTWRRPVTTDPSQILLSAGWGAQKIKASGVQQSSFDDRNTAVTPTQNGLVNAAIEAWNNHHHLVLRPDDIWLSIVCQLGFFINANTEELRDIFVSHQGKTPLSVTQYNVLPLTANYAAFAKDMAAAIGQNVNDPTLVSWAQPDFSTTTDADRVAGAVLLMGAMQHYFSYDFICETCGIPSVTLLGERDDWARLAEKIDRIPHIFQSQTHSLKDPIDFSCALQPLARHMVRSFDEPSSPTTINFWRVIASWEHPRFSMSGTPARYLTGWITAFCFWTAEGRRQWGEVDVLPRGENRSAASHRVDGVFYPPLEPEDIVAGCASVPVTVKWVDAGVVMEERACRMVAGSVAMRPGRPGELGADLVGSVTPPAEEEGEEGYSGSEELNSARGHRERWSPIPAEISLDAPPASDGLTAVQPQIGWWIFQEQPTSSLGELGLEPEWES